MTEKIELVWPDRLTLRDTKVFADEGQRIFTTATGYGYAKQEYVRADLAPEARPAAGVKPLKWIGPDFEGEYRAYSISGTYRILPETEAGRWLTEVGGYWPSVDAAKATAEAHHEQRILSALT